MKRDLDLIRKILLAAESDSGQHNFVTLKIEGYTREEISYHVGLLKEAGLINAVVFSGDDQRTWYATGMTWQGNEFLDVIRNDTRWNKLKEMVKERAGELSLSAVVGILTRLAEAWAANL